MKKKLINNKDIAMIGVFTAILCVLGPLTVPVGPIPFSLAPIGVILAPTVLKGYKGLASIFIYLLVGLVGIPVFSNFSGGFSKFVSPSGGFLIGYLIAGLVICVARPLVKGLAVEYLVMVIALCALYLLGIAWLSVSTGTEFPKAFKTVAIPFFIPDLIKLVIALFLGNTLRQRIDLLNK